MILVTHNIGDGKGDGRPDTGTSEWNCQGLWRNGECSGLFAGPVYAEVDEFCASFEARTYMSFFIWEGLWMKIRV